MISLARCAVVALEVSLTSILFSHFLALQIFQLVKNHGLGIDEATRALIVSRSFERAMTTSGSEANAIELLSTKMSLSNLLYESDEDQSSDEDNIIRSEQCVPKVSSADTFATANTSRSSKANVGRKRGTSKVSRAKPRAATTKTTTTSSSSTIRKRSIDEILPASKKRSSSFQSRPRSDSAAEEIDAKLAKQSSEDRESSSDSLISSPSTVRAKRGHRADDTDPLTQPLKRTRGAES